MTNFNTNLTLNWHFTNVCNMHCQYCFAPKGKDLTRDEYFEVLKKLDGKFERINFVGGEPTISPFILDLMSEAKNMGFKVSIVTNGFKMIKNPEFAEKLLNIVDSIGISVDSLNEKTNKKIGRCHCLRTLNEDDYISLCKKIKAHNLPLKINTVVSRANIDEDFSNFYSIAQPNRIKMFQVLKPTSETKFSFDDYLISYDEYKAFVEKHSKNGFKIVAEDNAHMIGSYIMLDASGRFENDETGKKSVCLLTEGVTVEEALGEVGINMERYMFRYA